MAYNHAENYFDGYKYETLKPQNQNTFLRDIDMVKMFKIFILNFFSETTFLFFPTIKIVINL